MSNKIIEKLKKNKISRFIGWPILFSKRQLHKYKSRTTRFYSELFTNVKEGSVVVDINGLPGHYEIDIRSHILQRILLEKEYEPEIVELLKNYLARGKDAVNIGANVGIFTVFMAGLIEENQKVLAVEPTPLAFKYLGNNIKRNDVMDKVISYNGICSDAEGEYQLNIIQGNEEYSSIGESLYISDSKKKTIIIKVEGETLNNLVNKFDLNPGLILIDVEGAEMKVLAGASKVIEKYKPVIIAELNDNLLEKQGSSAEQVVAFLLKFGYDIKDIATNKQVKFPFNSNIIAIPVNGN